MAVMELELAAGVCAFASGRPAVVNVLTDPTVVYGRSTQVAV